MKAVLLLLAASAVVPACAAPDVRPMAAADLRASMAVVDQVRRCYRSPRIPSAGKRIVTRLLVRYAPGGALAGLPLVVWQQGITPANQPYAGRMAEAAAQAVLRCSPVSLPPDSRSERGSEFYLTFSPQLAA